MKVWSIVGPHFMQAACHKDRAVSKKAVGCIHDAVTALLNEQTELSHFHFNEALFKPFENLLCLELCDADVQVFINSCSYLNLLLLSGKQNLKKYDQCLFRGSNNINFKSQFKFPQ